MTPDERNRVVSAVKAEERRRKKARESTDRSALAAAVLVVALLAALAVPLRHPKQLDETPPRKPDDAMLNHPPEQPGPTLHVAAVQTASPAGASPVAKSPDGAPASSQRTCANVHSNAECEAWVGAGHCDSNPGFMHLHCAAACAACATLDATDAKGYSPLVNAVIDEQEAAVAALLTAGAAVGAALHWACALGRLEIVRALLRGGARLEAMDSEGKTPLLVSGHTGHAPVIRALLEAGASPLATDPFGNSALHLAAFQGHVATVHLLLEAGAAVEAPDHQGATPARHATRKGRADVLRMLLEAGAAPGGTDAATGESLLHAAASRGHTEVMGGLLQAGLNPNPNPNPRPSPSPSASPCPNPNPDPSPKHARAAAGGRAR